MTEIKQQPGVMAEMGDPRSSTGRRPWPAQQPREWVIPGSDIPSPEHERQALAQLKQAAMRDRPRGAMLNEWMLGSMTLAAVARFDELEEGVKVWATRDFVRRLGHADLPTGMELFESQTNWHWGNPDKDGLTGRAKADKEIAELTGIPNEPGPLMGKRHSPNEANLPEGVVPSVGGLNVDMDAVRARMEESALYSCSGVVGAEVSDEARRLGLPPDKVTKVVQNLMERHILTVGDRHQEEEEPTGSEAWEWAVVFASRVQRIVDDLGLKMKPHELVTAVAWMLNDGLIRTGDTEGKFPPTAEDWLGHKKLPDDE